MTFLLSILIFNSTFSGCSVQLAFQSLQFFRFIYYYNYVIGLSCIVQIHIFSNMLSTVNSFLKILSLCSDLFVPKNFKVQSIKSFIISQEINQYIYIHTYLLLSLTIELLSLDLSVLTCLIIENLDGVLFLSADNCFQN